MDLKWDKRGSTNPYCAQNYWAGAKKTCAENEMRLPSLQELAEVATYIYKQEIKPGDQHIPVVFDVDRAAKINWILGSYWSNTEYGSWGAERRAFSSNSTTWYGAGGGNATCSDRNLVRCFE